MAQRYTVTDARHDIELLNQSLADRGFGFLQYDVSKIQGAYAVFRVESKRGRCMHTVARTYKRPIATLIDAAAHDALNQVLQYIDSTTD